jgi:signal transduction histidine kinase/DNA-binding LacI/PurR family transcriptional regulator/ActR/RegA family two-component response regulator
VRARRASQPFTRTPTIGVLADWLEGNYQSAVVGGAVEAARESGANLLLLADSMPRATFRFGERHNVVYDLGCSETVDGLVIMSAPVGRNLGLEDLAAYCERYRPRPMCSIGAPLEGMTGILVAGEQALREGIRHLVEDHQHRRIVFIGGPKDNLDARDRLRTYREALTACGLPPPDSYVVSGDFQYQSGADAIRVLLDERSVAFDAIVAASDSLALGAIDALRVRKMRVPRDVAVIGFDDISEARYSAPPLTTIRQPLRQQGRLAIEVILRRLRGERVDDVFVLPCELVVRRSCGCDSPADGVSVARPVAEDAQDAEEDEVIHRLIIERRRRSLSEATEILSAAFDLESLDTALRESLPHLGVPSAYIVLGEDASAAGARVVFAHDPGRDPAVLEAVRHARIQGTAIPDGLLPADRAYAMVVEPLFFKDDPLGYAVFEMRPEDAFTYDAYGALRVRISGALKVALLVEELQVRVGELRQAQKMETLGQLSGAIAHDFNNLLQAIRGYAELARAAEPGSAEVAADLEEIVRAADRASQLTRQLLTFSHPTRANARVVDVNGCVEEAIPMIRRLLGPAIELSSVLGPEAGNIVIDPAQLEQAILNLCVNGRDAMPVGGSLTIETGRRLAAAPMPVGMTALRTKRGAPHPRAVAMSFVAVSDTGVGISPEIRDRIFEPFFTTKEIGQGTGLGLSIVYGIVRNAAGDIVVESEPGRGTRFVLMFPVSEATQEATAPENERPVRGTETVLLVEDEQPILKLAERVLVDAGYRVLSAASGVEARQLWAANEDKVDLLLSDVTMPGLSGIAFAAELAVSGRPPRTLFISGRLPGDHAVPALPDGAAFLQKPFRVSALLDAVRATLDSSAASRKGGAGT